MHFYTQPAAHQASPGEKYSVDHLTYLLPYPITSLILLVQILYNILFLGYFWAFLAPKCSKFSLLSSRLPLDLELPRTSWFADTGQLHFTNSTQSFYSEIPARITLSK